MERELTRAFGFEVQRGIPPALRAQAAALFWAGFGRHIQPLPTPAHQAQALLLASMQPQHGLSLTNAQDPQKLLGLVSLRGPEGGLFQPSGADYRQVFGPVLGALHQGMAQLWRPGPVTSDMVLDGLVIDPHWRGRGLGAALIQSAARIALLRGHSGLRAEVEAHNLTALSVFKACGLRPAGQAHAGWVWGRKVHILRRPFCDCPPMGKQQQVSPACPSCQIPAPEA